ncbi:MAG: deacetylase [SAR324 cluster bacterium]|nr:deacetylase [SAR324 cluster bacterium]
MGVEAQPQKLSCLITIDTEGDNLWSGSKTTTTKNAQYLPRFQILCERYGLKPTYLTNYEMALSPVFQEFGKDLIHRQAGEIGMHLHAWNNPPLSPLTSDDMKFHPYLIEYPLDVVREKITVMTDLLEETFEVKMVSHRAGRWSFNEIYAQILIEKGYHVDCSVTPFVSWKTHVGDPSQAGGTDYSQFQTEAYHIDPQNIARTGKSPLLEIPMTVAPLQNKAVYWMNKKLKKNTLLQKGMNRISPPVWFRPKKGNLMETIALIQQSLRQKKKYVQFMLHSSELMPGGSPTFPQNDDIEKLYDDLETMFGVLQERFIGMTLNEFYQNHLNSLENGIHQ